MKWGALVMAVGYLLLCFGGDQAKPYAIVDGQRYEVQQEHSGSVLDSSDKQWLVADERPDARRSTDFPTDRLSCSRRMARSRKTVAKDAFEPGAERSPFYLALMLIALSLIVIGNGFFKPNISTIVGSFTTRATAAAMPVSRYFTGASTSARSAGRYYARSSSDGLAGGPALPSSSSAC